ncbi:cysteine--tRNA ligase [Candidatus Woesearchaeota archaeon]|nr:cysteine--tRNA ligase [Candidatus Woesearchaeota archaeon]
MTFNLYNTLSHRIEEFQTITPGKALFYACGPTVYNYAHIGNFRSFVAIDLLRRTLRHKGYAVTHVMNLTDVDDKTIRDSRKEGKSLQEFTEFYTEAFFEDFDTLNIERPEHVTKATDYIQEMIALIQTLVDKGYAYEKNGNVYYAINKFADYGRLVGLEHTDLRDNADGRLQEADEYDKDHARDFSLWKAYDKDEGDNYWESPWGKGRPGWHIECSVMSTDKLGPTFDLHAGGADLKFPHHTNEIAQAEAATGKKFCNYWFHVEFLIVEGEKMSKSLGNFYTIRDLLKKGYGGREIRHVLLGTHYRQKLNFTLKGLDAAKHTLERIDDFLLRMHEAAGSDNANKEIDNAKQGFEAALDDDLNISGALAAVHEFMKNVNKKKLNDKAANKVLQTMYSFDEVLGLGMKQVKLSEVDDGIEALIERREEARKHKDWETADKIRDDLKQQGIELRDTPEGPRWKRV